MWGYCGGKYRGQLPPCVCSLARSAADAAHAQLPQQPAGHVPAFLWVRLAGSLRYTARQPALVLPGRSLLLRTTCTGSSRCWQGGCMLIAGGACTACWGLQSLLHQDCCTLPIAPAFLPPPWQLLDRQAQAAGPRPAPVLRYWRGRSGGHCAALRRARAVCQVGSLARLCLVSAPV